MFLDTQVELLTEIRDLLRIIAEPALAQRDLRLRGIVRTIAGKGEKKRSAILLMNGARKRSEIVEATKIDIGALSRLIAELREAKVLEELDGRPEILCPLPPTFFDQEVSSE